MEIQELERRIDELMRQNAALAAEVERLSAPEVEEHARNCERAAREAVTKHHRLRRLWEFSAAIISHNAGKIKPRGKDEERLIELAKSADHGMAWSGTTDGWIDGHIQEGVANDNRHRQSVSALIYALEIYKTNKIFRNWDALIDAIATYCNQGDGQ